MQSGRESRISLRSLGPWAVVLLSVLVVGHALALLWTSSIVWRSAHDVQRETAHVNTTNEIDRMLREHHRLESVWLATRENELEPIQSDLEASLRRAVAHARAGVHGETEARRWRRLDAEIKAYIRTAEDLAARHAPVEEAAQKSRQPFERALYMVGVLREQNEANRERSLANAEWALRIQKVVVIASGALLVVVFVVLVLCMHRFVLVPLLTLRSALERFRPGESGGEISGGPFVETRELAQRFNEMVELVIRQRRDQLTFLAAVAHDLRNPLSALKLTVSSLEREYGAAKPERFTRLDRQIDRLSRMVGDLLDATRIESGQLELKLKEVDVREAARSMVDLYAPTTTTHRVTLDVPDTPVIVRADALRLEQVVSNLLSNAIKYSPRGGLVAVSVRETPDEVVLSVSDQGAGIPPEEVSRLFDPFRRGLGTADLAPGAGLGLSIVRRIVDAHGGRIDVESKPYVGSTFRVRLPRR